MNEFYKEKQLIVGHPNGWRYFIYTDEEFLIHIEYQEYDGEAKVWNTHQDCGIQGLWKESAKLVGEALIELSQYIEE